MAKKILVTIGLFILGLSLRLPTHANNFDKLNTTTISDEDRILAVCKSSPKIPGGWVIIGEDNVDSCRSNSIAQPLTNAWIIRKPTKKQAVCGNSPIPDNYVVTGEIKIAACPGGSSLIENNNGLIIEFIE